MHLVVAFGDVFLAFDAQTSACLTTISLCQPATKKAMSLDYLAPVIDKGHSVSEAMLYSNVDVNKNSDHKYHALNDMLLGPACAQVILAAVCSCRPYRALPRNWHLTSMLVDSQKALHMRTRNGYVQLFQNVTLYALPTELDCCYAFSQGVDLLEGLTDVDVQVEILDLGSLQSVISFAQRFKTSGAKVDVLINNAGIMGIPERRETVDGFEMHIGVNHFGPHLLTRLMEPALNDGGRVVFLSSDAHNDFPGFPKTTLDWDNVNYEKPDTYDTAIAYGRSKLGNVLDAKEFAKRLAARKINTYAVHPGVVNTDITRNVTGDDLTARAIRWMAPIYKHFTVTPLTGALTSLRCALDPELAAPEFSGKYWAKMKEAQPSALAQDPANPLRYWEVTESMLEAKLGKRVDELLA